VHFEGFRDKTGSGSGTQAGPWFAYISEQADDICTYLAPDDRELMTLMLFRGGHFPMGSIKRRSNTEGTISRVFLLNHRFTQWFLCTGERRESASKRAREREEERRRKREALGKEEVP